MSIPVRILNLVIAPLVVAGAVLLVGSWIANRPVPETRKAPPAVPRVAFIESRPSEATPVIRTFGNVRSYYETEVASQVGGEIVSVSPAFQAGEAVPEASVLVTINEADYLAAVAQQESALAAAEETLAEEESRSRIAQEDWLSSGRALSEAPEFTLRKPQLAAAQMSVASARSALAKAELDLERTRVKAPFDAIVQSRRASPGNVVTPGAVLGSLLARDRAEVRLPLTPDQVRRLDLPLAFNTTSKPPELEATLTTPSQPGKSWTARVARTEPVIDAQNQVVYVIAEIERPFDDPGAFLPVGAFVNATLSAAPLVNVHRLPESSLIEDRLVWILDAGNILRQQPVERLYSEDGHFLARIPAPVAEGPLRVAIRPLVSFQSGEQALPLDPNAPAERRGPKGGGPGRTPEGPKPAAKD